LSSLGFEEFQNIFVVNAKSLQSDQIFISEETYREKQCIVANVKEKNTCVVIVELVDDNYISSLWTLPTNEKYYMNISWNLQKYQPLRLFFEIMDGNNILYRTHLNTIRGLQILDHYNQVIFYGVNEDHSSLNGGIIFAPIFKENFSVEKSITKQFHGQLNLNDINNYDDININLDIQIQD